MTPSPQLLVATPIRGTNPREAKVALGYSEFMQGLYRNMPVETLEGSTTFCVDVVKARNRITAHVLRDFPHVTHVLWLDDDQWPEDWHIIPEMMTSGEHIIASPYTNKGYPLRLVYQTLETPKPPVQNIQEVRSVGFGCTMTTTECLRALSEKARKYTDIPNPYRVANIFGQLYDRITPGTDPEEECLLSEDYSFCQRARDAGYRITLKLDSGIVYHVGEHAFNIREMPGGVVG